MQNHDMHSMDPMDLPPPQEPSVPGSIVDLHGFIRLLLDKGWLIVSCIVLAVIGAAWYVQRAPRIFEAVNTVQVEQEDRKVVKAEQVVSEDMRGLEILNTIAQKLCNTYLLEQVLATNHLLPAEAPALADGSNALTREEAVKRFARNVKTSLRRNTRLIDISVRDTNAYVAAQLANSLVENYLGEDAQTQHATTEDASAFLKREAKAQEIKLEASEQALQDYRRKIGAVSLQESQDIVTPQLQDLNKRLTQSKANLVQAQGAFQDSLKMSTNIEEVMAYPQIATDPDVVQISSEVERQTDNFVLVRLRYREKHPRYILASSSLEALKQQLAATVLRARARMQEGLRIVYQNALTSQQGLELELHGTETNAMQLSDSAVRFNVLAREVESDKAQYDALISRLGETAVAEKITPDRIRVIQKASAPDRPVSPKVKLIFALAILGGLALGLGLSFVLSSVNTSFRTVDEVEHYLTLPVLGAIPKLPKGASDSCKLVAAGDGNSAGAEVFRTLRATMSMLGREENRRTYLFTSSLPNEGKTFVSANYAACLAQRGLRTLLVDMDLRRPMVEEFFTGKRHHLPGVTDYLLGRSKFEEVCRQHEDVPKLFWIPSGGAVPNASELLAQADLKQMLSEGLAQFDRIVIDTAPLLPVSDTLLLASKVQTVVLVVQGCKTSRKAVERSVQFLKRANGSIAGIVLNLLPNRRFSGGYHYSYYHGYGYGSYGKSDEDKAPVETRT
jgi:polysaccharide biosynthesis transport protein